MTPEISRVLDANLNRVREGLRVCEDISRFVWEREEWFIALRNLRHQISQLAIERMNLLFLIQSRHSENDIGRGIDSLKKGLPSLDHLFLRNFQRVKEGLRVLEEFSHEIDPTIRQTFQALRYTCYDLEKMIVSYWNDPTTCFPVLQADDLPMADQSHRKKIVG